MERKIIRQYENYDTVIPKIDDFPVFNSSDEDTTEETNTAKTINSVSEFKIDDLILIGLIIVLLMEKEKNIPAIIALGILFISDYID